MTNEEAHSLSVNELTLSSYTLRCAVVYERLELTRVRLPTDTVAGRLLLRGMAQFLLRACRGCGLS